ncbi:hypothetical protein TD95_002239 [Thielaviopsis punctulata]|uniref:4'-phosphopantetheinyl transferase domain-containing protein n=1 Tax=Thielaviopsis punctulata TaxID=72032 RepID=A0A0F4ZE98_9PEZI|nr:hypothetical protein TD95_002239 [Thielaviopsis punctulata]
MLPFPYPIRIGTDICQISRIRRIVTGGHGVRFLQRIFSDHERTVFAARLKPAFEAAEKAAMPERATSKRPAQDAALDQAVTFVAGRFAAKEAAFKAHSTYRLGFHDVHIMTRRLTLAPGESKPPGAAPYAVIQPRPPFTSVAQEAQVSISHDGGYATAVCLGFEQPLTPEAQLDEQRSDDNSEGRTEAAEGSAGESPRGE